MKALRCASILTVLGVSSLLATPGPPGPVPVADIGIHVQIQVGIIQAPYSASPYGNMGYGAGGGGGQFLGTVTGDPNYTGFWCVDDQITFSPPATAFSNIVSLSPGIDNSPYVRYSNVTNGSGTPHWTNQTVNGDNLSSSATVRYEMAAWLISQYTGFDSSISNAHPGREDAIQHAIWAITNNSTSSSGFQTYGALTLSDQTQDSYWIHQAYLASQDGFLGFKGISAATLDPTKWAVVTWGVNSTGGLTGVTALQTFLVEVVPEPGFYGVLAVGLAGLAFFRLRKRNPRIQ